MPLCASIMGDLHGIPFHSLDYILFAAVLALKNDSLFIIMNLKCTVQMLQLLQSHVYIDFIIDVLNILIEYFVNIKEQN